MTMNNDPVLLTQNGYNNLIKELEELTNVKRPEISQKIGIAREEGDLSENAAYSAARDEQALNEAKISELEQVLANYKIVDDHTTAGIVSIGSSVKLHLDGKDIDFQIVGANEANPAERKISHDSPLGSALIGKGNGDTISVDAPVGRLSYKIISVK